MKFGDSRARRWRGSFHVVRALEPIVRRLASGVFAVALAARGIAASPADDEAFFESRVRPVLTGHCAECHLDGKSKGGLRMDSRALLLAGGDSGAAAIPGDAEGSRLVRAIRYGDPDLRMPPRTRLPPDAVAALEEWVRRGLPDPRAGIATNAPPAKERSANNETGRKHWAFQPVRRAGPPAVDGVSEPIDRFLLARLKAAGLSFAPVADRRTWMRRVTMDLTGLPATEDAVRAFESDDRPDSRERCVDALMASPAYGERWARWWLDVARYADTNGQDENKVMANAWRYRDWVVGAMNADLPMDRFLVEQLAGDLLPADGVDERTAMSRRTATGFLVLGPKLLAEQDKPKLVLDVIDEQIDTIGRAMLGLTLGCARCHDHKFDPVSQREYYALAGIFRSTRTMENLAFVSKFNERDVSTRAELDAIAANAAELAALGKRSDETRVAADAALRKSWREALPRVLAHPDDASAPTGLRERVAAVRAGTNGLASALRGLAVDPDAAATMARWEAALASEGPVPGRSGAAFVCRATNSLEVAVPGADATRAWTLSAWVRPDAIEPDGDTRRWLVSRGANEWVDGHLALVIEKDRVGAFANAGGGRDKVVAAYGKPGALKAREWRHLAASCDATRLRVYLDGAEVASMPMNAALPATNAPFVLGRRPDGFIGFRGRLDSVGIHGRVLDAAELGKLARGETVAGALATRDFDALTDEESRRLADRAVAEELWDKGGLLELPALAERRKLYPSETQGRLDAIDAELAGAKARAPLPAARALAVADDVVTNLPVMARGSHMNPGKEAVPRGFPKCVGPLPVSAPPADHSGRLELARWIVDPSNPLTARVLANRVWQAHFGEGLVRTPDNFGLRGEGPSHPELLDWLASEWMRSGWSLKAMHRRIVLSRAYAQSAVSGEVAADADNRLLHAFPRQRLEAEMLRDALLSVGGRLDRTLGGTLVSWKNDEYVPGDDAPFRMPRRTLYLPLVRDRGIDLFAAFDGANPSVSVARRGSTVVSPQALYLMNSPVVREAAEGVARRVSAHPEASRVGRLYGVVLARAPSPAEAERARRFLEDGRLSALDVGGRWTALAQALLASNEFTHRE